MRKRGKYEALPVAAPVTDAATKAKKAGNSLLKTYLMSVALLLVSCAMFIGTTAAWFTAEVTNTGNQIQVGVLSADLLHGEAGEEVTEWTSLKKNADHKVFGAGDLKWKPGSSDVQVLQVVNDGELLMGYQVTILADITSSLDRDGNQMAQSSYESLAESFSVYCAPSEVRDFDPDQWRLLGTLADIMAGKPIYSGVLAEEATEIFSVAIVMDDLVDNVFMGHKLEMYLKLTAYQGGEGFTPVSGEEGLREALLDGGDILLLENIVIHEPLVVADDATIVFNGKNLTFTHTREDRQYAFHLNDGVHLTLDAEGATVNAQNGLVFVDANTEAAVTLRGGTYLTPGATGEHSGLIYIPDGAGVLLDVVMENMTYNQEQTGWLIFFGSEDLGAMNVTLNGCAVSAGHGILTAPSGKVTITDSTIHAVQGLAIKALTADGVNITDTALSAGYPGADLNASDYIFTVAVDNGATVHITGGGVVADDYMYALAVLTNGGNITAEDSVVDEASTFIHEDEDEVEVGTITIQ